jgi:hypothetical protein
MWFSFNGLPGTIPASCERRAKVGFFVKKTKKLTKKFRDSMILAAFGAIF